MQVLAVEPYPQNVLRLHKGAQRNKVDNRFKVIMAPVSDKRGSVIFYEHKHNIGGNGIFRNTAEVGTPGFTSKSIILDDLVPFIDRKIVLLKMDIQSAECHVFSNAHKFFEEFDVPFIIMEFGWNKSEGDACVEGMLEFLNQRNYTPFNCPYPSGNNNSLNFAQWRN